MYNPIATYRIQFHKGFTFTDFEQIIPYLHQLGVSTIYASPIFQAVPGSNHGYDVTDPHRINPEIGNLAQFRRISKKLKSLAIGWLQDIVPNHMAFHPDNRWLWDVLEKGKSSAYSPFFDILWDNKLMVPFLGDSLDTVIKDQQLQLLKIKGRNFLSYGGTNYPIAAGTSRPGNSVAMVAKRQHYELCDWRESNTRMNYRRFFTVNGLICLNMQDQAVFDHYHEFIQQLVAEGLIQGLRVDHIDGLFDPKAYLEMLRQRMGPECYIVVEKILEDGEHFPDNWPVQGNTGYDFLAQVNNLLTDRQSRPAFTRFYEQLTGNTQSVSAAIPKKKAGILSESMGGELENLYQLALTRLNLKPDQKLKTALGRFLIQCPVYRFYVPEKAAIDKVLSAIPAQTKVLSQLRHLLLKDDLFFHRCMQFTGPLMAKGVEDTLMYTYDRFIGHNEVGDSPDLFGLEAGQFHRQMMERQKQLPLSLNSTSTHDTKRGEDVRARLNVLTDRVEEWLKIVPRWQKMNRELKVSGAPDENDEYLIYQTLVGCFPFSGLPAGDLPGRLEAYLVKALREAKVHSGWSEPDQAYEAATVGFALKLLDQDRPFYASFQNWLASLNEPAMLNSLTQVLLKFTCPGIPDVYQGCESWDLSLVDPDNRRPVDYKARLQFLKDPPHDLYAGIRKTRLTAELFWIRKQYPELFSTGDYLPLRVKGEYKNHLLAFARKHQKQWAIVLAPLHLGGHDNAPLQMDWENTAVILPDDAPLEWQDLLSGNKLVANEQFSVSELFSQMPLALLFSKSGHNPRGAGIILPVSSLPSEFPIGDIGPAARRFIDFLSDASQRYWQLLPLNPVSQEYHYSPYSSYSSMAGNTLLISPVDLVSNGWLSSKQLSSKANFTKTVRYAQAERQKDKLFHMAWQRFKTEAKGEAFAQYQQTEAYWLDDFALYLALKAHHQKPWYHWPAAFKNRNETALRNFAGKQHEAIEKIKWLQYIFQQQWNALKDYAHDKGIKLIGDLPFYISYDSADVWTHPHCFKLTKAKAMAGIAGVPPDYFNDQGQLWGMPVYDWAALKNAGYDWWVRRLRKNMQFFDLLRLDHFRAFYDYWEVPASENTAINGSWQSGPGADLFQTLSNELGKLPFIAEDLGDITPGVYQLRDSLGLPGMNVLQYAFGPDMPVSPYAPHNHKNHSVTYTGTHDNNTAAGWFRQNATKTERRNLENQIGQKLSQSHIHETLVQIAYSSAANVAIIPMQDVLGLDENARLNTPGVSGNNWQWRLRPGEPGDHERQLLVRLAKKYNRQ